VKIRSRKSWSYRQITPKTEIHIREYMQEAKDLPERAAHASRTAWGVYCGWLSLMAGYEAPADHARLRALTGTSFKPVAETQPWRTTTR